MSDVGAVLAPVLEAFTAAGTEVLVLAADGGRPGYDERIAPDTGHLLIGGTDPAWLVRQAPGGEPPAGAGPVGDVRTSLEYLSGL